MKDYPVNIANLTSYIKFGINDPTSCLARSLGIKNRNVALFLYENSGKLTGHDFIKWLSNLSNYEIWKYKFSKYDKENILDTALKLIPNSYREVPTSFEFSLKGIYYNEAWWPATKTVEKNNKLFYKRDYKNEYDPYAILILKDNNPLGFVPREFSKILSSEIDIEETNYDVIVTSTNDKGEFNEIFVTMNVEE